MNAATGTVEMAQFSDHTDTKTIILHFIDNDTDVSLSKIFVRSSLIDTCAFDAEGNFVPYEDPADPETHSSSAIASKRALAVSVLEANLEKREDYSGTGFGPTIQSFMAAEYALAVLQSKMVSPNRTLALTI